MRNKIKKKTIAAKIAESKYKDEIVEEIMYLLKFRWELKIAIKAVMNDYEYVWDVTRELFRPIRPYEADGRIEG